MTGITKGRLIQQNTAVEGAPLQKQTILFHSQSNRFCILNSTSTFIWNCIKSPVSPEQVAEQLSAHFPGVTLGEAFTDVEAALKQLLELDLVITTNSV
jgi:Coenzyme PQQ synthesis protein D (PqqD)